MSNQPAFPSHGSMGEVTHEGMTLRDYFAAKAMAAMLADPNNPNTHPDNVAMWAYRNADAMLKAREVAP